MMAKNSGYNFSHVILTLFVCLLPVFGSACDKTAVIYASLCVFLGAAGYAVYKRGSIFVTKTLVFSLAVTALAFLQLIWVSDKGSQTVFAALMLMTSLGCILMGDCKKALGEKSAEYGCRAVYLAAQIYAFAAILHQIFIAPDFLMCDMSIGNNSPATTAVFMLAGMLCGIKLFYTKKKPVEFFGALLLLGYVFVMTKSLIGFLAGAVMVFVFAMNLRHKRVEAFFSLVLVAVLGVINVIFVIYTFLAGKVSLGGVARSLTSVIGLGVGGFDANMAVLDKAHSQPVQTISLIVEIFGFIGVGIIVLAVILCFRIGTRRTSFRNLLALLAVVIVLFTSSSGLIISLPMLAMYFSSAEEAVEVKVPRMSAWACVVPMGVCLFFTFARVPYAFAKNACDLGNYEEGASYYAMGAGMELFNSNGWYEAYKAAAKGYEVNNTDNLDMQKIYLENAMKFNKKNYEYRRLLADVHTKDENYIEALNIWDSIVLKYDNEYLYPEYGEKICDVMEKGNVELARIRSLYEKLMACEAKTVDKDIKFKVNNILAESQKYYIAAREGSETVADLYPVDENVQEAATSTAEEL